MASCTGRVADQYRVFEDFSTARDLIHKLKLRNQDEWKEYCRSGKKPSEIPANPARRYKKEWIGMGDWLGTGTIASFNKQFRTYAGARDFVRSLRIESLTQWRKYIKSGQKPEDIPTNPNTYYSEEWRSWGDFLGTGFVAFQDRKYRDFDNARDFTHGLGFKNRDDWIKYTMSKSRPQDIPADPSKIFKDRWKGWGDWLGTGTVAPKDKKFLPFNDARAIVQAQNLGSIAEWSKFIKKGNKPDNIPSNPDKYYKTEWKSWGDWLGTGTLAVKDRVYMNYQDAKHFVHQLNLTAETDWFQYAKSGRKWNLEKSLDKVWTKRR